MAQDNNKQDTDGGHGRDPGQDGQDIEPLDRICPLELKSILDRINKRYKNVLRRLAGEDGI
jgi:hypothetical protein